MDNNQKIAAYCILINEKSRELDSKRNFVFAVFAFVISVLIAIIIFRFTEDTELKTFSFCNWVIWVHFIIIVVLVITSIVMEYIPYKKLMISIKDKYMKVPIAEIITGIKDNDSNKVVDRLDKYYDKICDSIKEVENLIGKVRCGLILILIAFVLELARGFLHEFIHPHCG